MIVLGSKHFLFTFLSAFPPKTPVFVVRDTYQHIHSSSQGLSSLQKPEPFILANRPLWNTGSMGMDPLARVQVYWGGSFNKFEQDTLRMSSRSCSGKPSCRSWLGKPLSRSCSCTFLAVSKLFAKRRICESSRPGSLLSPSRQDKNTWEEKRHRKAHKA